MSPYAPLVLSQQQTDRMGDHLVDLLEKTQADAAFLIRQDGRLLASFGHLDDIESENLSAVIAGCVANAREMAELLRDSHFTLIYNRGSGKYVHNALVDDDTILSVFLGPRSSLEGVRQRSHQLGARIAEVLAEARQSAGAPDGGHRPAGSDEMDEATREHLEEFFGSESQGLKAGPGAGAK